MQPGVDSSWTLLWYGYAFHRTRPTREHFDSTLISMSFSGASPIPEILLFPVKAVTDFTVLVNGTGPEHCDA